jgi:hypothetical protein
VKEWADKEQELSLVIGHCETRAVELHADEEKLQSKRREASVATASAEQRLQVTTERVQVS